MHVAALRLIGIGSAFVAVGLLLPALARAERGGLPERREERERVASRIRRGGREVPSQRGRCVRDVAAGARWPDRAGTRGRRGSDPQALRRSGRASGSGYTQPDDLVFRVGRGLRRLRGGSPRDRRSADDLAALDDAGPRLPGRRREAARRRARRRRAASMARGATCRASRGKACKRERRDARLQNERASAPPRGSRSAAAPASTRSASSSPRSAPRPSERVVALTWSRRRRRAPATSRSSSTRRTTSARPPPSGPSRSASRTLELADPSRARTRAGTGPRPVTVEVYYPSTDGGDRRRAARTWSSVLGITVVATPAYRDVARGAGALPARPLLARQRRHPLPVVLLRRAPREPRLHRRDARTTTATPSSTLLVGIVDPDAARTGRST